MNLALDFLLITGLLTTLLILIILIGKKSKEFPQRMLIYIFSAIFLVFLSFYAYLHRIRWLFYGAFIFFDSVDVLIGPLLLIYFKGVIGSKRNSFKHNYIYFIFPMLYIVFISIPLLIAMIAKTGTPEYIKSLEPLLLFVIVYSYGYCLYTVYRLMDFKKLVKLNYSSLEHRNLNWIKYLLLGAIGVLSIDIFTSIYETIFGEMGLDISFITVIPVVFLVMYLGYYGVSQSTILLPYFLLEKEEDFASQGASPNLNKVANYSYDAAEMKQLQDKLNALMRNDKPFLDEDLALASLSGILEVPDKKLSTLLNQHMKTSFYDYINGHRVEAFKSRLATPDANTYTLLAIAYDCGFKSKSSFNRIFKNTIGLSPSEYQKSLVLDRK